ncbi:MAG: Abi family protein [Pseudarcicella sp.]|nr:Abi family protein [Pseudarcicella sp.]MBP6410849.1 Abi family protein [Pseudarcicella sp.]
MSATYNKIPLSFQKQIELLKSRHLIIDDEPKALSYLQEISYYRLSAYFLPYQNAKDNFENNITFDQIIKTYSFDRELRLLVFDCIERIEVAIRTQFIYQMALHYNDSHWQDNQNHFITPYYNKIGNLINPFADFQAIISKAKTARTPETFIKHYINSYNKPANPPSWMCFELLTIGELSHIYRGLKNNADKKRIADFFEVHHTVFTSWLHTLTYVRNICAHHSRLWNRDLAIEPEKLLKPKGNWIDKPFENNKRVFYFLCTLRYMLLRANPGNSMKQKLENLFNKYPTVPIKFLGIPSDGKGNLLDWKNEPLWK